MPTPIDPAKREAIAAEIRAGELGRNTIARLHGVSGHLVTKIAQEDGLDTSAWDRTATKRATAAKTADLAARRAELAGLLMQDAFDLRERMWQTQQQVLVVGVKGGGSRTTIVDVETSASDYRNYATSIGILVDKVGVLTRDESQGLAAVDAWLRSITGEGTTEP